MAIIGALSIGMGVNTAGLSKGLLGASGLINQFTKSASLAGGGLGMLAADTAKFGRGVAQDAKFFAQITGITPGIKLAGRAMGGLATAAGSTARGIGSLIGSAGSGINKFGSDLARAGHELLGIKSLLLAIGAGAALKKTISDAMSLGEQTDRAKIIFGDYADVVTKRAKMMADAFGVSKAEFVQSATAMGTVFKAAGYDKQGAAQVSTEYLNLATNVSSLVHMPVAEVLEKLQSGLAGQVRPLHTLGVFMTEAGIEAYAAAHGIGKLGQALTEQQKIQSRTLYIADALKDAQGNLALTAGSAANQTRMFWGQVENLSSAIGESLLPIVASALGDINTGLQIVQAAWNSSSLAAAEGTAGVIGNAQQQSTAIGFIQSSVVNLANAWQFVDISFSFVQSKITSGLIHMAENFGGFADGIGRITSFFTGLDVAAGDFTKTWIADLKMLQAEQTKTFEVKATAPLLSEGINKAFDMARAKTQQIRADLAKSTIDINKIVPKNMDKAALEKGKHQDPNTAASFGSSEAANAILKSRFGSGGSDKPAETTAANTTRMAASLDQIAGAIGGIGAGKAMAWDSI